MYQDDLYPTHSYTSLIDHALKLIIETANAFGPETHGAFSGGKDSTVLKHLVTQTGITCNWYYLVTTLDPPESVQFIRRHHPDVQFIRPDLSFHDELIRRGPPTPNARWCCLLYKERYTPTTGPVYMGMRAAESRRRATILSEITSHRHTHSKIVLPIFRWADDHIWHYIRDHNIPYCTLYDEGFDRIGCVGCPLAYNRPKHFQRWPTIAERWHDAITAWWNTRVARGQTDNKIMRLFPNPEEYWTWYATQHELPKEDPCGSQIMLDTALSDFSE